MSRKSKITERERNQHFCRGQFRRKGKYKIKTGIGFLDHMLEQLSKHSLIDLEV